MNYIISHEDVAYLNDLDIKKSIANYSPIPQETKGLEIFHNNGTFGRISLKMKNQSDNRIKNDLLSEYAKLFPEKFIAIKSMTEFSGNEYSLIVNEIMINKLFSSLPAKYAFNFYQMHDCYSYLPDEDSDISYAIEMPFYTHSLQTYIKMHDFIDIMDIIDMALQIFRTLTIVHSMSIIYGDIKPGNIMINLKDNHLTFIDYGGCRLMKCNKLCIFKSENELMEYDNHPGTVPYMSPEAIENNTKDYPSDVWAATLVVLELICCQTFMPKYITLITHYKNIEDRIKVIRSGKFNTLANPELMACLFNIASSIEQLDLSLVITELFAEIYKHSEYDKKIIDELKEAIIGGLLIDDKRRYTALEIYEKIQKIYKKIDIKSDYLKN